MAQRTKWLPIIYIGVALLAFVACWRQNLLFIQGAGVSFAEGFVVFWPALLVNHATTSITVDIFLVCVAAMIWMVVEARRLGIRHVWVYVLLSFPIAISVMFPLFLAARERALANPPATPRELGIGDRIGLGLIGVSISGFAIWTLVM